MISEDNLENLNNDELVELLNTLEGMNDVLNELEGDNNDNE